MLVCIDIWCFIYTFSNICWNLLASGVRNALQSVESGQISSHTALLSMLCYLYNTSEQRRNAFPALHLIFGAKTSDMSSKYGNNTLFCFMVYWHWTDLTFVGSSLSAATCIGTTLTIFCRLVPGHCFRSHSALRCLQLPLQQFRCRLKLISKPKSV